MTWAKFDDAFPEHPKVDALSDAAFRLHVHAICWSCKLLTDGFIPEDRVARLTPRYKPSHLRELLDVAPPHERACWVKVGGGYQIHDFLEYQQAAEKVTSDRAEAAERMRTMRAEKAARKAARSGEQPSTRSGEQTPNVQANGTEAVTPHVRSSAVRSPRPDPTRPVPTDAVTPSLATKSVGAEAEGGSGSAEEPPTATDPMDRIRQALTDTCPPDRNRLYGDPERDLRRLLDEGRDVELAVCAIRQGATGEGAPIRVERAIDALKAGKVPTGDRGGVPSRPYAAPTWDPPPDPVKATAAIAAARAALRPAEQPR